MTTREQKQEREVHHRLREESLRKQRRDKELRQRIFSEGLSALESPGEHAPVSRG